MNQRDLVIFLERFQNEYSFGLDMRPCLILMSSNDQAHMLSLDIQNILQSTLTLCLVENNLWGYVSKLADDEVGPDQNKPFAAKMKHAVLSIASTRPTSLTLKAFRGGHKITFLTVWFANECLNRIPKFSLGSHE